VRAGQVGGGSSSRHVNSLLFLVSSYSYADERSTNNIGGFNQRQGEALPPQIFLTLKFVVCTALKTIDIVAT